MAVTPMRLTASEARDLMNLKKDAFYKTMGILRQMADTSIREASRRGRDGITFDVPASVFGRESYDPRSMGKALAEQYYEDGYDVTGTPTKLKIRWPDSTRDGDDIKFARQQDDDQAQAQGTALPFTAAFQRQLAAPPARKSGGPRARKTSVAIN